MLVAVLATLAASTASPTPNEAAKSVEPLGVGLERCSVWLDHHARTVGGMAPDDEWLSGFLTGFNTFGRPPVRRSSFFRFDTANVVSAITGSCTRNKDQTIFDAATQFVLAVQKKGPAARSRRSPP
jgi:hypothetical protein